MIAAVINSTQSKEKNKMMNRSQFLYSMCCNKICQRGRNQVISTCQSLSGKMKPFDE